MWQLTQGTWSLGFPAPSLVHCRHSWRTAVIISHPLPSTFYLSSCPVLPSTSAHVLFAFVSFYSIITAGGGGKQIADIVFGSLPFCQHFPSLSFPPTPGWNLLTLWACCACLQSSSLHVQHSHILPHIYHINRDIIQPASVCSANSQREEEGGQCFWMAHATALPSVCPAPELEVTCNMLVLQSNWILITCLKPTWKYRKLMLCSWTTAVAIVTQDNNAANVFNVGSLAFLVIFRIFFTDSQHAHPGVTRTCIHARAH